MAVSSWQWLWDFEREAYRNGDAARVRLASFRSAAYQVSHDAPDEKLAINETGRELARQLGEPWWEMFYEHWCIEVLLFGKQQPKRALDRVVRAVFETSKPAFAAFPQRISLQMNLIAAYSKLDPIGYQSELRGVFAHIEAECAESPDNRAYYLQLWGYFLEQIDDVGAIDAAYDYLQAAEESGADHYVWDALSMICTALIRFDPEAARDQLRDLATLGEEIARREAQNGGVTAFLMWRALAARWDGQENEAQRFCRRAMTLQSRLPPPRNSALFGAVEFHLAGGDLERALQICQTDVRILHAHELTFLLADARLRKCRLLLQLGRNSDFSREAKRVRRVAALLPSQGHWEARIEELEKSAGVSGV